MFHVRPETAARGTVSSVVDHARLETASRGTVSHLFFVHVRHEMAARDKVTRLKCSMYGLKRQVEVQ